ncbi:MAG: AmmeMemoRadiSam system protein B [Planctomycetes bacterium]|nr:AmmeMemoRadiSam system protein B [Planctomycetota bacterium]
MPSPECPRLRPFLAAAQDGKNPWYMVIWDRLGLGGRPVRVTLQEFSWVQLFDGRRNLRDIQTEAMRQVGGQSVPLELFQALVRKLEESFFLDGPRFQAFLDDPIRAPTCLGCYEPEPAALRRQLTGLFTGPGGPGLPRDKKPDGRLRAALLPHIDYQRGGVNYTWGFREVFEHTDAALFVIIGTSHYSAHRFTLTRKNFKTPLGVVPTDQAYIDRLVSHYGDGLFDDPLAHVPEHSIELEVVFLQYLYEGRRPIRIVPLVVGAFEDCVAKAALPHTQADIGRMVHALRRTEEETGEPICYIISGDLAHIGPKFGDPDPVGEPFLTQSREQDQAILRQAEAADPAGYFHVIAAEGDRRRICGLPPTYTVLEALRPSTGKVLRYDQYLHPRGHESVSFASMAFYR